MRAVSSPYGPSWKRFAQPLLGNYSGASKSVHLSSTSFFTGSEFCLLSPSTVLNRITALKTLAKIKTLNTSTSLNILRMSHTQSTMKAIVLSSPGPPSNLQIQSLPIPIPQPGQVLIKVKAFGLNRSELHTRLGLAIGVTFPRVLGIEATGVVMECPGGEFKPGQQVFAMMHGMGRQIDGGYAEYTCPNVISVIPFTSHLEWSTLGKFKFTFLMLW